MEIYIVKHRKTGFSLNEANDDLSVSLSARGKLLVAFLSLD